MKLLTPFTWVRRGDNLSFLNEAFYVIKFSNIYVKRRRFFKEYFEVGECSNRWLLVFPSEQKEKYNLVI